ncbi:pEARLI1-like lipid transfer protein 3 [Vicia villosa]|uniref:pEARLI1-like lipid transfer protein 3 n=1 Tax=Vicia villosa TaxID=3911 RepID=UPI00273CE31F|nr:pEARLI1-like lipid transfer protein 3 [Vicia villosa]
MTLNKLSSIILVFSLLSYSTFTDATDGSSPSPNSTPIAASPSQQGQCPIDNLKLRDCVGLLGVINYGNPPFGGKCCALIDDLVDLEAATCLCIALKANVLGIKVDIPINLSLILSACKKTVPPEYKCV